MTCSEAGGNNCVDRIHRWNVYAYLLSEASLLFVRLGYSM